MRDDTKQLIIEVAIATLVTVVGAGLYYMHGAVAAVVYAVVLFIVWVVLS